MQDANFATRLVFSDEATFHLSKVKRHYDRTTVLYHIKDTGL